MLDILSRKGKHHLFLEILMEKLEQYVSERVGYQQSHEDLH